MRVNHVIRSLVLSDFFVNAGFSVFAPVFAIFVTRQIAGASIEVVGYGAAIVQIAKIAVELPLARILDRNHGEVDDFISMIFGSILIASVPFLYLLARDPIHIYIIQAVYGLGIGFTVPPWYAIFSRHLDKMQESFEWTMDSVSLGLGGAAAAAAGGAIAQHYGFHSVFILGGILAVFGGAMQLLIFKNIKKKVARGQVKPEPDKVAG